MTLRRVQKLACIAVALAGVTGCCGVILSAVGAHLSPSPLLSTAAEFLLIHAAATLAIAGLALAAPQRSGWLLGGAALFLLGSLLFCGDLSLRALMSVRLFPMAAPVGGAALILGWGLVVVAAVAALWPKRG